jgi:hypothetical protein
MSTLGSREEAIEACTIVNEFLGDLVAGTFLCRCIEKTWPDGEAKKAGIRTLLFSMILTLCKYYEIMEKYSKVVRDDDGEHRKFKKEVERRYIQNVRNKYVAHVLDRRSRKPLTPKQKNELLRAVTQDNLDEFLAWLNEPDPAGNKYPSTVVSLVEHTRDVLMRHYQLSREEVIAGAPTPVISDAGAP